MVLCIVKFLAKPDAEGRLAFDVVDSTIGNANDLAAHVLLLLPFLFSISDSKPGQKCTNAALRIPAVLFTASGSSSELLRGER